MPLVSIVDHIALLPRVLKAAQEPKFCVEQSAGSIYNLAQLREPWVAMRESGYRVDHIFLTPTQAFDIRVAGGSSEWFDYESQNCLLDLGLIGTVWEALLLENNDVPKDTLVFVGRKPGSEEMEEIDLHVGVLKLDVGVLKLGVSRG